MTIGKRGGELRHKCQQDRAGKCYTTDQLRTVPFQLRYGSLTLGIRRPPAKMTKKAGGQFERNATVLVAFVTALHGPGENRQDQERGENHNGCDRSIHQIMVYVQLAAVLNKRAGFNHKNHLKKA